MAGGGLAAGFGQPGGVWAGYGAATAAALVGCATLWRQRGLLERHAEEIGQRRRADLEDAAVAAQRHDSELEHARDELEHERQYSILIQDQLSRVREQLERERTARRAAERELDALTGATSWPAGKPSLKVTVEEPNAPVEPAAPSLNALTTAQRRGWQVVDGDGDSDGDAEDEMDRLAAETDRLYRPFIDHLAAAAVPVSDAALAMAPVIGTVDADGVLDLTAYDETVEFSVGELKRMA